jgi:hypothetical protein
MAAKADISAKKAKAEKYKENQRLNIGVISA